MRKTERRGKRLRGKEKKLGESYKNLRIEPELNLLIEWKGGEEKQRKRERKIRGKTEGKNQRGRE